MLFDIARLRERLRQVGVEEVATQGRYIKFAPVELADSQMMRLKRLHAGAVIKTAVRQILVPIPMTAHIGGHPLADSALIEWTLNVVDTIIVPFAASSEGGAPGVKDR